MVKYEHDVNEAENLHEFSSSSSSGGGNVEIKILMYIIYVFSRDLGHPRLFRAAKILA